MRFDAANEKITVVLHKPDAQMRCYADIEICETGKQVKGFLVVPTSNQGISVYMPRNMGTTWNLTEIAWSEVRMIVSQVYRKQYGTPEVSMKQSEICRFYAKRQSNQTVATVIIHNGKESETLEGIVVTSYEDGKLHVHRPHEFGKRYNLETQEKEQLSAVVIAAYRHQIMGENLDEKEQYEVIFSQPESVVEYQMDLRLPHHRKSLCGFRVKYMSKSDRLIVATPIWMGRWNDSKLAWTPLCELIGNEFCKNVKPILLPEPPQKEQTLVEQSATIRPPKKLMRVSEAKFTAFGFYPQSVMRNIEELPKHKPVKKKTLYELAYAMSQGSRSGIGPFEVGLLEWIAQLRFVTKTMLVDIINAGFVSFGWRMQINLDMLTKILNRMYSYDMIRISRFVAVDDKGEILNDSYSVMQIYTIGQKGAVLLSDLGHNKCRFDPFEVFHDANTVRRWLSANQWLVYFLHHYGEEIGSAYQTNRVVHCKGENFVGARVYAGVTLCGHTLVAESIRRTEAFEVESTREWIKRKLKRFIQLFNNLDQLYCGLNPIHYPSRPIIVILCEDDAHIKEVWDDLREVIQDNGQQKVWITSDLRIFNSQYSGERFLEQRDEQLVPVDLVAIFGKDNEHSSSIVETGHINPDNLKRME